MFKSVVNIMSGNTVKRLKSVIVVPEKSTFHKAIDRKVQTQFVCTLPPSLPPLKRSLHVSFPKSDDDNKNHKNVSHEKHANGKKNCASAHEKHSNGKKNCESADEKKIWPSSKSLSRHAYYKPLGVNDDWGPLSHKHELMPMNNVRYWHQHRCEVCDKLFEHKHKQRGDQSMNYNQLICSVCGGTNGSRRVIF